ncbi:MAG TPA: alpha-ketoglutarate-dependent dioxygenase AlkB [Ilumatobacteraceae bacterium]|nr:alpha-ketoglutarate-dependent dioxygenase AlkB [Ilumatobacteraceae bacterium]
MYFQGSLLSGAGDTVTRTSLDHGAWVDVCHGWQAGADGLLGRLIDGVAWRAERRTMYDRVLDVPRLMAFYGANDAWPDATLGDACRRLNDLYAPALGEPLVTAGLCYYRDGNDSVAWHGDTIGRAKHEDTVVAIISLGARRSLALRPAGGGRAIRFDVGNGDLLVMGGSCQRTWEHAVPKSRHAGPRVSIQFRVAGVR